MEETLLFCEESNRKICGIDEAGRGSIAGPLVVAGVVLLKDIDGLNDSKILSAKKREILYEEIIQNSKYKIIFSTNEEVDKYGLSFLLKKAIKIIKKEFIDYQIIMDGNTTFGVEGVQAIIKADSKIKEVSAASILAKVSRDRYMIDIDSKYPNYLFAKHKGYGTKVHIEMIKKFGLSPIHRKSFKVKVLNSSYLF